MTERPGLPEIDPTYDYSPGNIRLLLEQAFDAGAAHASARLRLADELMGEVEKLGVREEFGPQQESIVDRWKAE